MNLNNDKNVLLFHVEWQIFNLRMLGRQIDRQTDQQVVQQVDRQIDGQVDRDTIRHEDIRGRNL